MTQDNITGLRDIAFFIRKRLEESGASSAVGRTSLVPLQVAEQTTNESWSIRRTDLEIITDLFAQHIRMDADTQGGIVFSMKARTVLLEGLLHHAARNTSPEQEVTIRAKVAQSIVDEAHDQSEWFRSRIADVFKREDGTEQLRAEAAQVTAPAFTAKVRSSKTFTANSSIVSRN